ncbi:hypothetical protein HOG21_08610 [bacterium]|jgi:hypothetical protein|nr:hypothetical protein [bacterium]
MKLNKELLEQFRKTGSKILAVTKYHDKQTTEKIIENLEKSYPEILE